MEFKGKIKKVEEKQIKGTFEFRKIIIETQFFPVKSTHIV